MMPTQLTNPQHDDVAVVARDDNIETTELDLNVFLRLVRLAKECDRKEEQRHEQ